MALRAGLPGQDRGLLHQRTARVHPAVRRDRAIGAGGHAEQPRARDDDADHRRGPIPHPGAAPRARRDHRHGRGVGPRRMGRAARAGARHRRRPGRRGDDRHLAVRRPRLLRRAGRRAADGQPAGAADRGRRRELLAAHGQAVQLPGAGGRHRRRAAARDEPPPDAARAHPRSGLRAWLPDDDHAPVRGRGPVPGLGRGLGRARGPDHRLRAHQRPGRDRAAADARPVLRRQLRLRTGQA